MTKTKTTLASLIASHKFDWVSDSITEETFPLTPIHSSDYKLYHFDKYISSKDAVKEMEKDDYVAANLHELLLWKEWNENDLVVALGSVGEVDRGRYVPCLGRGGSGRNLSLPWWDFGWNSRCRFLAVRNSSSETQTSGPALGNLDALALAIETVKKAGYQVSKII